MDFYKCLTTSKGPPTTESALLWSSTLVASPQNKFGERQIQIQKRLLALPHSFFFSCSHTRRKRRRWRRGRRKPIHPYPICGSSTRIYYHIQRPFLPTIKRRSTHTSYCCPLPLEGRKDKHKLEAYGVLSYAKKF